MVRIDYPSKTDARFDRKTEDKLFSIFITENSLNFPVLDFISYDHQDV